MFNMESHLDSHLQHKHGKETMCVLSVSKKNKVAVTFTIPWCDLIIPLF